MPAPLGRAPAARSPGTRLGPEQSSTPARSTAPPEGLVAVSVSRSRPRTSGQASYGTSSTSGIQRRASWRTRWDRSPQTLNSRNNLAHAYQSAGDLRRAVPLFEATVAKCRPGARPRPPRHAHQPGPAGVRLRIGGRPGPRYPMFEATLTDRERVLGPDHPHTLALSPQPPGVRLLASAGDLDRAIPLFEATLTDCERVLGPDHPDTAHRPQPPRARLPVVGRPGPRPPPLRVHPHRPRARTRTRPPRHAHQPQQPRRRLRVVGRPGPSVPLHEPPHRPRTRTRTRPPRHPHQPQQPRASPGIAGRLHRAVPLAQSALRSARPLLGPDHPDALRRNNLAGAYQSAGDLGRAIPLFEATSSPTTSGSSVPTIPDARAADTSWPTPSSRRAIWIGQSRCSRPRWPTGSGCSVPSVPTRLPAARCSQSSRGTSET